MRFGDKADGSLASHWSKSVCGQWKTSMKGGFYTHNLTYQQLADRSKERGEPWRSPGTRKGPGPEKNT